MPQAFARATIRSRSLRSSKPCSSAMSRSPPSSSPSSPRSWGCRLTSAARAAGPHTGAAKREDARGPGASSRGVRGTTASSADLRGSSLGRSHVDRTSWNACRTDPPSGHTGSPHLPARFRSALDTPRPRHPAQPQSPRPARRGGFGGAGRWRQTSAGRSRGPHPLQGRRRAALHRGADQARACSPSWSRRQVDRYVLRGRMPETAIPTTLHGSLMARLDRAASAKEVAQLAACIGREFSHEMLAAASTLEADALRAALDAALEQPIDRSIPACRRRRSMCFVMRSFRRPPISRSRRPGAVSCTLVSLTSLRRAFPKSLRISQNGWHITMPRPGHAERASECLLDAARRARSSYALREAAAHLEKCIAILQTHRSVDAAEGARIAERRELEALRDAWRPGEPDGRSCGGE